MLWHPVKVTRVCGSEHEPVRAVRAFVLDAAAGALAGRVHDVDLGDVDLCASEVATNSFIHSASRLSGGGIEVRVLVSGRGLRVEIEDDGGMTLPKVQPEDDARECGRGLMIVEALASAWGYDGGGTTWFEVC
ncbi:ATP-binding protein [Spirillospora sp. NBC_01491]|uniref:ATP-binding protein n=1 Tax=Spirillospora sp. NBC_01491 TaxID=2976007 RepID=UPI002E325B54|nr:ATP-binding protein [Spirillospora sp. NBC_01491]